MSPCCHHFCKTLVGLNRTDRLYAIDEALRRARPRGTTATHLAQDLEVSVRTIKRDVSALQQAGVPIWARPGPGGGYVLDTSASLPPVAFTAAQAVALAVTLAAFPTGPFAVDARTAAAKVLDTLAPAARARAELLASRVWTLAAAGGNRARPRVLRSIERSLVENLALAISYRSADGSPTRRVVQPVIVSWTDGRWYLVAHCTLRDDIRWFRLARIERADLTRDHYEPRPVTDIGAPPMGAAPVGGARVPPMETAKRSAPS